MKQQIKTGIRNYLYSLTGIFLLTVFLTACSGGSSGGGGIVGGGGTGDKTAPTVIDTAPTNSATNIDANVAINVNFSEAMDATTINATTFTLTDGSNAIPGTVTYSGTMATFTPAKNLDYAKSYTATMTTDIKDLAGNALSTQYVWSFTTATERARYAYVANAGDKSVSTYHVDAITGRLKFIAIADAGTNPQSVTLDPAGKYAYAANYGSNTISQYAIESNGSLTSITTAADAGTNPQSITIDPSGKYAYVANYGSGNISQYTIESNGALTPITTAVNAGTSPKSITVDPTGKYVYVANYGSNTVSQFTIGANGALTPITADINAGSGPSSVIVDSQGKYVYVVNSGGANVTRFEIKTDGSLNKLNDIASGLNPQSITLDPAGTYAYVTNKGDNTVSRYVVDATGDLTNMTTAKSGKGPQSININPLAKYAYVINADDKTVSQYVIETDGNLTPTAPAAVAARTTPVSMAISRGVPAVVVPKHAYVTSAAGVTQHTIEVNGALTKVSDIAAGNNPMQATIDPTGRYVYVPNSTSKTVSQYNVQTDGSLQKITSDLSGGIETNFVAVDPTGKYAYVLSLSQITQYMIQPDGSLGAVLGTTSSSYPNFMTIDASGKHAYETSSNGVVQYSIDPVTGELAVQKSDASVYAASLILHPSGKYAYAPVSDDDIIREYNVTSDGSLTIMQANGTTLTAATGDYPASMAIDPTGRYAYVSNYRDSSIWQYTIDLATGALVKSKSITIAGATSLDKVTIDPSGQFLYVTDGGYMGDIDIPGAVWQFVINSATGELSSMTPSKISAGIFANSVSIIGTQQ